MLENGHPKMEVRLFRKGERVEDQPETEDGLILRTLNWIMQPEERKYLSALTRLIKDHGKEYGIRLMSCSGGVEEAWLTITLEKLKSEEGNENPLVHFQFADEKHA